MAKTDFGWFEVSTRFWMMSMEASYVIWLRSLSIAAGGAAGERETRRMVEEKLAANIALGFDIVAGKLGTSSQSISSGTVSHYARRVSANRKRLTKATSSKGKR